MKLDSTDSFSTAMENKRLSNGIFIYEQKTKNCPEVKSCVF